ncbi:MAG TPA: hypothetical protein VF789_02465 [Thermoanaerobaculia bacterium]
MMRPSEGHPRIVLALVIAIALLPVNCGPGGEIGGALLAERLGSLENMIDLRLKEAIDSGDYYIEKAAREARIAAKTLAWEFQDERNLLFRDADNIVQQAILHLEQQVNTLSGQVDEIIEIRELAYLDLQNLANVVLPADTYVLTSLHGFSQFYSSDGRPYRFRLVGNPFQIGGDTRIRIRIDGHEPANLRVTRANMMEFSLPATSLAKKFNNINTVRVPFELTVDRRAPKRWYRKNPEWKRIYEYADPEGVLLLPKYPARVVIEEIYAEPYIDTDELKSLETTIRVGASGKKCKNDDHSCARSCVNCKVACIDLPEGAQLVRSKAWEIDVKYGKVKSHNKGGRKSGPICAHVANWRDSKSATFGYKIDFYPQSSRTTTRPLVFVAVDRENLETVQRASENWIRFGDQYEVTFDPKRFRSYNLAFELFTKEKIWLSMGATDERIRLIPDFGTAELKRLRFVLNP